MNSRRPGRRARLRKSGLMSAVCVSIILLAISSPSLENRQISRKPPFKEAARLIPKGYTIPLIDLSQEKERQVVVDRQEGQYLGHPTTILLEDNKTMIAVYPKGHGRGAVVMKQSPDGRLFITFRDTTLESPTKGDWVGWVGTYDDILHGKEGQYRVRLMDNFKNADCAYPGLEILPDGTFVSTSYGHWTEGEPPYIVCVRFHMEDIDNRAPGRRYCSEVGNRLQSRSLSEKMNGMILPKRPRQFRHERP